MSISSISELSATLDLGGDRGPAESLAQFVSSVQPGDIPGDAVHAAKRAVLDAFGCALAASQVDELRRLRAAVECFDHGDLCLAWGTRSRYSQPMAALINGTSTHARELDDCGGPGHVGPVVIPAAFAVAETHHKDGASFLAAVVIGYEVLFRIANALGGFQALIAPGWHPIAVVGAFGSAAAAGASLELSADKVASALGLAGSYAGGVYAFLADGSMAKRWHTGRAAANGVEAAYLARAGFSGPASILGTQWGSFPSTHFPGVEYRPDAISEGLGTRYLIAENYFKTYPCCWGIQPYAEGLKADLASVRARQAEIVSIRITCSGSVMRNTGMPGSAVRTVLDAQLSMAYSLAALLVRGRLRLEEYDQSSINDDAIRAISNLISLTVADQGPPSMRISYADGSTQAIATREPRGSTTNPLSDADLEQKFLELATPSLGPDRCRRLADAVWGAEHLEDVTFLRPLLQAVKE